MGFTLLVLAAGITYWLVLLPWFRRLSRWRRMELALPGPPSLPLLGNVLSVVGTTNDTMLSTVLDLWGGRRDELSRISFFNHLLVFVSDPDHIKEVLRSRRFCNKSKLGYYELSNVLGNGLITASGPVWKSHRLITQPAFHLEFLERFVEVFAEEAAEFVSRIAVGSETVVSDKLYHLAARTVIRTVSTVEPEDEPILQDLVAQVPTTLKSVMIRISKPWLWVPTIFDRTAIGRQQSKFTKKFEDFVNMVINRKESNLPVEKASDVRVGFKERKTFVDAWLTNLTRSEIVDEMKTVTGAATETSVATVSYLLKMLSIHPHVQQRVHDEIRDVFQDRNGPVTSSDLPRLCYLERALKETMRVFPIIPFVARAVTEDTVLLGKVIPADTTLIINIMSAHSDPRHWPDPMTFDPDRFLPERSAGRHPYCYIPFSAGPRDCIGKQYAMMQMKTLVATILRAYRILPVPDGIAHPSQFKLGFGVSTYQVGGTKVRFEPILNEEGHHAGPPELLTGPTVTMGGSRT